MAEDGGVLTGPMFSHLIGNMVLRKVDEYCARALPARYVRYVDDICLVGDEVAVRASLDMLNQRLGELGLRLHDETSPKSLSVATAVWCQGRNDFHSRREPESWLALVRDLKQFLVAYPHERGRLRDAFLRQGMRVPVRDYARAVREPTFLEGLRNRAQESWFRRKIQRMSVDRIVERAVRLRDAYEIEFRQLLQELIQADTFGRKRCVPKLRYRAARLVYLATDESLQSLTGAARDVPELRFQVEVMAAVSTGTVDGLLAFGSNAAQAAAQPLKAADRGVRATDLRGTSAEAQALAAFMLNGVTVELAKREPGHRSELMRFASEGVDPALMRSQDPFMQEIACLHGISKAPLHPAILETALDEDEALAMDAVDQMQQSTSD
jgi:hypothetical protein